MEMSSLWYAKNISVEHSQWFETALAEVWHNKDIHVKNAEIAAPKNLRR